MAEVDVPELLASITAIVATHTKPIVDEIKKQNGRIGKLEGKFSALEHDQMTAAAFAEGRASVREDDRARVAIFWAVVNHDLTRWVFGLAVFGLILRGGLRWPL